MATVPSETTVVAGSILTAAMWNSNVRDGLNFILSPPFAVLRQTVAQAVTSGNWTALGFDTEDLDRDNGHSTTSNSQRYFSQTAGWYSLKGSGGSNQGTAGINGVAFAVNSGSRFAKHQHNSAYNLPGTAADIYLNVNDYVEYQFYQSTGATQNTAFDDGYIRFQIRWVST